MMGLKEKRLYFCLIIFTIVFIYWEWLSILWEWISEGESNASIIRTFFLVLTPLVALCLAMKRIGIADRQSTASEKQSDIAKKTHLDERYHRGVEMLSSDFKVTRIGGIHVLSSLSRLNPKEYHCKVLDVFCVLLKHLSIVTNKDRGEGYFYTKIRHHFSHEDNYNEEVVIYLPEEDTKCIIDFIRVRTHRCSWFLILS